MARPIEYDLDEVLEGAMNAFWAKGYPAIGSKITLIGAADELGTSW